MNEWGWVRVHSGMTNYLLGCRGRWVLILVSVVILILVIIRITYSSTKHPRFIGYSAVHAGPIHSSVFKKDFKSRVYQMIPGVLKLDVGSMSWQSSGTPLNTNGVVIYICVGGQTSTEAQ